MIAIFNKTVNCIFHIVGGHHYLRLCVDTKNLSHILYQVSDHRDGFLQAGYDSDHIVKYSALPLLAFYH